MAREEISSHKDNIKLNDIKLNINNITETKCINIKIKDNLNQSKEINTDTFPLKILDLIKNVSKGKSDITFECKTLLNLKKNQIKIKYINVKI